MFYSVWCNGCGVMIVISNSHHSVLFWFSVRGHHMSHFKISWLLCVSKCHNNFYKKCPDLPFLKCVRWSLKLKSFLQFPSLKILFSYSRCKFLNKSCKLCFFNADFKARLLCNNKIKTCHSWVFHVLVELLSFYHSQLSRKKNEQMQPCCTNSLIKTRVQSE